MTYSAGNEMVDAQLIFAKAHLRPNMHVADFGCGTTGHLVFPGAKVVGEHGVMYAVDIVKNVLSHIQKRADLNNQHNIHTVWTDLERVGLCSIPKASLDVVFIVNMLVQAKDHGSVLQEAARLLKPKGRVVIVDWIKKGLTFSPNDDYHINFDELKKWAKQNNFSIQEEFDVGQFHFGLVLYRHE